MGQEFRDVLIDISVIVQVPISTPDTEEKALYGLMNRMEHTLNDALGPHPDQCGWIGTRYSVLDPREINCGRCTVCNAWVTDRNAAEPLYGLPNGARVDGQILCDKHLPEGHRWHF